MTIAPEIAFHPDSLRMPPPRTKADGPATFSDVAQFAAGLRARIDFITLPDGSMPSEETQQPSVVDMAAVIVDWMDGPDKNPSVNPKKFGLFQGFALARYEGRLRETVECMPWLTDRLAASAKKHYESPEFGEARENILALDDLARESNPKLSRKELWQRGQTRTARRLERAIFGK